MALCLCEAAKRSQNLFYDSNWHLIFLKGEQTVGCNNETQIARYVCSGGQQIAGFIFCCWALRFKHNNDCYLIQKIHEDQLCPQN